MLQKQIAKKSWFRFGLKLGVAGVVLECTALAGSYLFYRRLNRDTGEHMKFVNSLFIVNLQYFLIFLRVQTLLQ